MTNQEILNEIYSLNELGIPLYSKKAHVRRIVHELKLKTSFLEGKRPSSVARIYCLEHNITEHPTCKHPTCSNTCSFLNANEGFRNWCSSICSSDDVAQQIIREQTKQTNLEKYDHVCTIHNKDIHVNMIKSNLEKYGVEYASASSSAIEKKKRTNIERYGVDHPWKNEDVREKIEQTLLDRYGNSTVGSINQFRDSIERTNLERYGSRLAILNDDIAEKARQTRIRKYKRDFSNQTHIPLDSLDLLNNKEWLIEQHIQNQLTLTELAVKLGVCSKTMTNYFCKHDIKVQRFQQSIGERELCEFLTEFDIKYVRNDREILAGKELDILIPDHGLAIEYCGVYWHSEQSGRDKWYHNKKMELCTKQNIRLLTIFEDEWKNSSEIIKSTILSLCGNNQRKTVYARKTKVVDISNSTKLRKEFFNKYHIQGNGLGSISYGLYDDVELVACMLFSVKGNRAYLERYATNSNVPGGFTKLLHYFEKNNCATIDSIVTFADKRWSVGNLYRQNGFVLDKVMPPDYSYSINGCDRIHKFNFRHAQLSKRLQNYNPSLSERVNCDNNGVLRIWDCGKYRFIRSIKYQS